MLLVQLSETFRLFDNYAEKLYCIIFYSESLSFLAFNFQSWTSTEDLSGEHRYTCIRFGSIIRTANIYEINGSSRKNLCSAFAYWTSTASAVSVQINNGRCSQLAEPSSVACGPRGPPHNGCLVKALFLFESNTDTVIDYWSAILTQKIRFLEEVILSRLLVIALNPSSPSVASIQQRPTIFIDNAFMHTMVASDVSFKALPSRQNTNRLRDLLHSDNFPLQFIHLLLSLLIHNLLQRWWEHSLIIRSPVPISICPSNLTETQYFILRPADHCSTETDEEQRIISCIVKCTIFWNLLMSE